MQIEELIERYGDDILRLCIVYLGQRQLAEDAFQDTFLKAWKGMESFRGDSSWKTWLSRIAVNTCRDMLRSGWLRILRKSRPFEELAELPAKQRSQEEDAVREATLQLPGLYREVIVLYYHQGMTTEQIGQVLGISGNTVSTRLRRARQQLAKLLGEEAEE